MMEKVCVKLETLSIKPKLLPNVIIPMDKANPGLSIPPNKNNVTSIYNVSNNT